MAHSGHQMPLIDNLNNDAEVARKRRRRFGPRPDDEGDGKDTSGGHVATTTAMTRLLGQTCRSVDCYERLNFIDEGTYGRVFRARDIETDEVYALKQVKLGGEREGFPVTALREMSLLLALRHPNIVHVREIVVGSTLDKIYMVMEYAEHDLRSVLDTMRHPYSQSEVKSLMQQLLRGVVHMHNAWVLHRDLKTANLLVTNTGVIKVCDFGLARRYGDPLGPLTPNVTTLWYRAPEILLGATIYTPAVDMWSVGCIFAELVLMDALFPGQGELDQLAKICALIGAPTESTWPSFCDLPNAKNIYLQGPPRSLLAGKLRTDAYSRKTPLTAMGVELLAQMLALDPERRITADEALQHPYFSELPAAKEPELIQTLPERLN
jgi:cell division cycle 2-like